MTNSHATLTKSHLSLDEVAEQISEISTLPQVALRVMDVVNDPTSGARDLKEVLEGDAALSARVLRSVNSSAYATRTEITNLQQAIAYLGTPQIRNLALTASVSKLFAKNGSIGNYDRTGLWRHLIAVGICARMIATRLCVPNPEDVFLAGLLHDVGIILEDQYLHADFTQVVRSLDGKCLLAAREREFWGFDHTMLAEAVMKSWHFPDMLIAAARHHHDSIVPHGEHQQLVWCVEVANVVCSIHGFSSIGLNLVKLTPSAVAGLALTRDDVVVLVEDIERELMKNQDLFQL